MLGDGELPSYEEPPCQECSPVPDYCSTGQTVLDPCGCCEECAKGEGDECGGLFGLYGTCADDLECVENSEDPENVPGECEQAGKRGFYHRYCIERASAHLAHV